MLTPKEKEELAAMRTAGDQYAKKELCLRQQYEGWVNDALERLVYTLDALNKVVDRAKLVLPNKDHEQIEAMECVTAFAEHFEKARQGYLTAVEELSAHEELWRELLNLND